MQERVGVKEVCVVGRMPTLSVQKMHAVNHVESFQGQQATCWQQPGGAKEPLHGRGKARLMQWGAQARKQACYSMELRAVPSFNNSCLSPRRPREGVGGEEPGHIPPSSTMDATEASRKALMCIYRIVLPHLTQHFHVSVVHRGYQHVV